MVYSIKGQCSHQIATRQLIFFADHIDCFLYDNNINQRQVNDAYLCREN